MAVPPVAGPSQGIRPFVPVLNTAWRRVNELPERAQQDAMLEDDEWEEDEVEYVSLEFAQNLTDKILADAGEMQLLAPESATPYARIGHHYYEGTHEMLIGNDILLKHQPKFHPAYVPFATSSHRITFQPINLEFTPEKRLKQLEAEMAANADAEAGPSSGRSSMLSIRRRRRKPGRPKGSKNKPKPPRPEPESAEDSHAGGDEAGPAPRDDAEEGEHEDATPTTRSKRKGKARAPDPPTSMTVEEAEGMDEVAAEEQAVRVARKGKQRAPTPPPSSDVLDGDGGRMDED
ncbi:hypothetical protein JCM10213_002749 [Rhodosporidiobolus nylandii]